MNLKQRSVDVYIPDATPITLERHDLEFLKKRVSATPRKRIRICIHTSDNDLIHEMFIVNRKDTYIRPHKHLQKKESYHVIEGKADIILFDEKGSIQNIIPLGNFASGKDFYYKLNDPIYHTMVIHSEYLVFVEVTNGPFRKDDNIFAPWSPDEKDAQAVNAYLRKLKQDLRIFLSLHKRKAL